MIKLKETVEFRAESEEEAKQVIANFKEEAREKGYEMTSASYTYKKKTQKGEIVDECYLCKVVNTYGGIWDGLE